jgi:hypothetical protein
MNKIKKEELADVLGTDLKNATENQIENILHLYGFRLLDKEFEGSAFSFEVHFGRNFAFKVTKSSGDKQVHYNNRFISTSDGDFGICAPISNIRELLNSVLYFADSINYLKYSGPVFNEDYSIYTQEEFIELFDEVQVLMKK